MVLSIWLQPMSNPFGMEFNFRVYSDVTEHCNE